MTAFLVIIIIVLAIVCFGLWLAIKDYKIDLAVSERNLGHQNNRSSYFNETAKRRGQLLNDISEALPNDVSPETQELYSGLWKEIQEEIGKELKQRT